MLVVHQDAFFSIKIVTLKSTLSRILNAMNTVYLMRCISNLRSLRFGLAAADAESRFSSRDLHCVESGHEGQMCGSRGCCRLSSCCLLTYCPKFTNTQLLWGTTALSHMAKKVIWCFCFYNLNFVWSVGRIQFGQSILEGLTWEIRQ